MIGLIRSGWYWVFSMGLFVLFKAQVGLGYDITDKFSVEVSMAGVYQHLKLDADETYFQSLDTDDSVGRGSAALDLGLNFHPTDQDEFQLTLSFAGGNGLKYKDFFSLVPNADDLESDVKNINLRDRDYLLEAWYKHTFKISKELTLSATLGIIDATVYLDENEYANDETTQFMNEVFVNNPLLNLPSYDAGGALELKWKDISLKGLYMASKTEDWSGPDSKRGYGFYGVQLGYKFEDPLGEGNLRLIGFYTTKDFVNWDGDGGEPLRGYGISLDHGIGESFGFFFRSGWQDDKAVVIHKKLFSGGINISGRLWGREQDNIGLGYAFLDGVGRAGLDSTNALEGYVRFRINDLSFLTFDIQHLRDKYQDSSRVDGTVYGMRFTFQF